MTKTEFDIKNAALVQEVQRLKGNIAAIKDMNQELKDELTNYRTAIAAVKWLWEQAEKQKPFQL